jgi:hypothetical protein
VARGVEGVTVREIAGDKEPGGGKNSRFAQVRPFLAFPYCAQRLDERQPIHRCLYLSNLCGRPGLIGRPTRQRLKIIACRARRLRAAGTSLIGSLPQPECCHTLLCRHFWCTLSNYRRSVAACQGSPSGGTREAVNALVETAFLRLIVARELENMDQDHWRSCVAG